MKRVVLGSAVFFLGLTAVAAVAWWLFVIRRAPTFPSEHIVKVMALLVGVALVQLLSLGLVIGLIRAGRRSPLARFAWLALGTSVFVLCANALYFFTPAIGAPIVVAVCSVALVGWLACVRPFYGRAGSAPLEER